MLYVDGQFGEAPLAGRDEIERAISAAAARFLAFSRTPAHARAALLTAIAEHMSKVRQELAMRILEEARKPIAYARAEVHRAIMTLIFAADEARRLAGEVVPLDAAPGSEGRIGFTMRVPRGPIAAITPFNFPLNLAVHKLAPALALGTTIVHKPAPETPEVALDFARIANEAGVPRGVLNVVPCQTADAAPLIEDPRLRVLSFTGSAAVGWALKARAATKQVLLELGGDAAVIVEPDIDLDEAMPRLVTGAFAYAGQVCISVQRIFIHETIYKSFVEKFLLATEKLALVGDLRDERVMLGPLIRTSDADRVEAWIAEAKAMGARVLLGGRREGDTIWPTVLSDVPRAAKLGCEEAFGPVVSLFSYASLDEAISRVNSSHYGLQAGIYTNDHRKLFKAFRELEVGGVIHNDVPMYRADHMPYGGTKRSGTGREGVRHAIEEMTEPKLLVMNES